MIIIFVTFMKSLFYILSNYFALDPFRGLSDKIAFKHQFIDFFTLFYTIVFNCLILYLKVFEVF